GRAEEAVRGAPERQVDERRVAGQQRGETARQRRLRRALLAPQQHTADRWVDGGEEARELGVVVPDPGAEREPRRLRRVHRDSSQPSAASSAERSVSSAPALASHKPRSCASRRRSAIAWSAHGFDRSKNFLTSGSATYASVTRSYIQSSTTCVVASYA